MRTTLTLYATLLLLAGCGSSPKTNFYTLSVIPGTTGRHSISSPVQLTAVHLPPALDRRQMVRMSDANSVTISETNRWSAPLDEMVRNVLAQDLVARLPRGRVILPEAPAPAGTRPLVVTIARFGPDAAGEVKLAGSWALLDPSSGQPVLERDVQLSGGPAPNADATAAAMSQVMGELADQIASALAR
jgi:uncharacterized protein